MEELKPGAFVELTDTAIDHLPGYLRDDFKKGSIFRVIGKNSKGGYLITHMNQPTQKKVDIETRTFPRSGLKEIPANQVNECDFGPMEFVWKNNYPIKNIAGQLITVYDPESQCDIETLAIRSDSLIVKIPEQFVNAKSISISNIKKLGISTRHSGTFCFLLPKNDVVAQSLSVFLSSKVGVSPSIDVFKYDEFIYAGGSGKYLIFSHVYSGIDVHINVEDFDIVSCWDMLTSINAANPIATRFRYKTITCLKNVGKHRSFKLTVGKSYPVVKWYHDENTGTERVIIKNDLDIVKSYDPKYFKGIENEN